MTTPFWKVTTGRVVAAVRRMSPDSLWTGSHAQTARASSASCALTASSSTSPSRRSMSSGPEATVSSTTSTRPGRRTRRPSVAIRLPCSPRATRTTSLPDGDELRGQHAADGAATDDHVAPDRAHACTPSTRRPAASRAVSSWGGCTRMQSTSRRCRSSGLCRERPGLPSAATAVWTAAITDRPIATLTTDSSAGKPGVARLEAQQRAVQQRLGLHDLQVDLAGHDLDPLGLGDRPARARPAPGRGRSRRTRCGRRGRPRRTAPGDRSCPDRPRPPGRGRRRRRRAGSRRRRRAGAATSS